MQEYQGKELTVFNSEINTKWEKAAIAGEYRRKYIYGKVFLIPQKRTIVPKKNKLYYVLLNKHPFHYGEKTVYPVKIVELVEPETVINGIRLFKNIFVPKYLIRNFDGKGIIIFREPKEGKDSCLILLYIKDESDREIAKNFLRKSLLAKKGMGIKEEGEIVEMITSSSENPIHVSSTLRELLNVLSED